MSPRSSGLSQGGGCGLEAQITSDELKGALIALYGKRGWQAKGAAALGVDASTVRRWTSGQIAVPGPVAAAVACFLAKPLTL